VLVVTQASDTLFGRDRHDLCFQLRKYEQWRQ
jgi:hypothetical protein